MLAKSIRKGISEEIARDDDLIWTAGLIPGKRGSGKGVTGNREQKMEHRRETGCGVTAWQVDTTCLSFPTLCSSTDLASWRPLLDRARVFRKSGGDRLRLHMGPDPVGSVLTLRAS